jgi:DNA-directed RNA polymerase
MVFPYSGTVVSAREKIAEEVDKRDGCGFAPGEERAKAVKFLARAVWASIPEVVVRANDAMRWLRKMAGLLVDADHDPTWVTPSGFVVRQVYQDFSELRVETALNGKVIRTARVAVDDPNKKLGRKHRDGLSPNFVHSLDASALVLTVNLARSLGVEAFAMVHDGYGTHAADIETLSLALRRAFVDMYETHDVLNELRKAAQRLGVVVEECPNKGSLDLGALLREDDYYVDEDGDEAPRRVSYFFS